MLKVMNVLDQKKNYQDHIHCSFACKLVCVDDRFSKSIVVYRGENAAYKSIEAILEEYEYCKEVMKKHFNKNLIKIEDKQENFNQVTLKNSLKMTMKKLEIIVT